MEFTSPIHIKISKLDGSYITAGASSQTLRRAHAQALKDRGSDIPVARNNLKEANQYKKGKGEYPRYIRLNASFANHVLQNSTKKQESLRHQGQAH